MNRSMLDGNGNPSFQKLFSIADEIGVTHDSVMLSYQLIKLSHGDNTTAGQQAFTQLWNDFSAARDSVQSATEQAGLQAVA